MHKYVKNVLLMANYTQKIGFWNPWKRIFCKFLHKTKLAILKLKRAWNFLTFSFSLKTEEVFLDCWKAKKCFGMNVTLNFSKKYRNPEKYSLVQPMYIT